MTHFLFICNSGEALPIAHRIRREGDQVDVYIHNRTFARNYDGILPKLSMKGLRGAVDRADLVVFDMNKPVENQHDKNLQKLFGAKGDGLYGSLANAIRATGRRVLGSSGWTERIELSRDMGSNVAAGLGLSIPDTQRFRSLSDGLRYLNAHPKQRWVFKPSDNQDLDLTYVEQAPGELVLKMEGEIKARLPEKTAFILQEVIDGVEISTEGWFRGDRWWGFNHTIEDKCLMNYDLGPRIGSANNTVWIKRKPGLLTKELQKMTPKLKRAGYIGPVDVNAIVSARDHKPYFLEFTPRLGYDAVYCTLALTRGKIGDFFRYAGGLSEKRPRFSGGYASSVRVSVPPYPYEEGNLLERARGIAIDGQLDDFWMEDVYNDNGLKCAGADGILGVVTGIGNSIGGSAGNVYRNIEGIRIAGYRQYRTDLGKRARSARRKLTGWSLEVD